MQATVFVVALCALITLPSSFAVPVQKPPKPPVYPSPPPSPPPLDLLTALQGTWEGTCAQYAAAYANDSSYCYDSKAVKDAIKYKYTFTFAGNRYSYTTDEFNKTLRGVPLYFPAAMADGNFTTTPKNFTDDKATVSDCITISWSDGAPATTIHVALQRDNKGVKQYVENGYVNTATSWGMNICPGKFNPGLVCDHTRYNYRCSATQVIATAQHHHKKRKSARHSKRRML